MSRRLKARAEDQPKVRKILDRCMKLPGNQHCAECGRRQPRWCSTNLGIFICIRCSGFHRNMGVHLSTVKSTTLDTWPLRMAEFMETMGNIKANQTWEAKLPKGDKPTEAAADYMLSQFLKDKYEHKKWIGKTAKKKKHKKQNKRLGKEEAKDQTSSSSSSSDDSSSSSSDQSEDQDARRRRRRRRENKKKKQALAAAAKKATADAAPARSSSNGTTAKNKKKKRHVSSSSSSASSSSSSSDDHTDAAARAAAAKRRRRRKKKKKAPANGTKGRRSSMLAGRVTDSAPPSPAIAIGGFEAQFDELTVTAAAAAVQPQQHHGIAGPKASPSSVFGDFMSASPSGAAGLAAAFGAAPSTSTAPLQLQPQQPSGANSDAGDIFTRAPTKDSRDAAAGIMKLFGQPVAAGGGGASAFGPVGMGGMAIAQPQLNANFMGGTNAAVGASANGNSIFEAQMAHQQQHVLMMQQQQLMMQQRGGMGMGMAAGSHNAMVMGNGMNPMGGFPQMQQAQQSSGLPDFMMRGAGQSSGLPQQPQAPFSF